MAQQFDKSAEIFPIKKFGIALQSCGVAPLCAPAFNAEMAFSRRHMEMGGNQVFPELPIIEDRFHAAVAALLKTSDENITYVRNSAEGLSMLANGYPFEAGDEVISYVHEYPSNHYPWRIQERRGVKLKLIADSDPIGDVPSVPGRPRGFDLTELERLVTPRTRVVALSHTQFTSGFTVDLPSLGKLCASRGIDLIIDVAQSLGALPVFPEHHGIAAVVGSGWKWLLGPLGSGLMYTEPTFRQKIAPTLVGPETMQQGTDYLDHTYNPHTNGRRFEYSTYSYSLMTGLEQAISQVFLKYEASAIRDEIFRLQNLFLEKLDRSKYHPLEFAAANRAGILSLISLTKAPAEVVLAAKGRNLHISTRGGYLRIAPHFYTTDEEMLHAVDVVNSI